MAYMQQDKVKIELGGISASMFFPLWGRAQLSKKYSSLFYDAKAIELVEKIDYDFSTSGIPFQDILSNISFEGGLPLLSLFSLRAKQFDEKVKAYIRERPRASVVNIGAGLDTTFYHVDNGTIHWYGSTFLLSLTSEGSCCRNPSGSRTSQNHCWIQAGAKTSTPITGYSCWLVGCYRGLRKQR